ncbi:1-acyl-sn-glycerol-3-phosphate acyltransferase, partial [bacterium]|nr:1-acyl-sn-glycerol-3-phosphate acyltransferase [bacterium]
MAYLFVFRIILLIIIFIVCLIPYLYLNFNSWWIKLMSKLLLKVANFKNIKVNNAKLFKHYINTDKKLLVVANHKCLFDGFVLLNSLQDIGFMLSRKGGNLVPFMNSINKKSNSFFYEPNQGTETLIDKINLRKINDNIIVVFADSMNPIPIGKNIAPFKTGAFQGKFDILPVVIKYKNWTIDPTFRWYDKEHPFIGLYKILLDGNCEVITDVMNLVS